MEPFPHDVQETLGPEYAGVEKALRELIEMHGIQSYEELIGTLRKATNDVGSVQFDLPAERANRFLDQKSEFPTVGIIIVRELTEKLIETFVQRIQDTTRGKLGRTLSIAA
jgi:hypothetical protein